MSGTATMDETTVEPGQDEFSYRPVPPLVPISAAFVFLSITAFMWDVFIAVPVIGTVLALVAWRQIARSNGDYSGGWVAAAMSALLPAIAIGAAAFHIASFLTELPPGYQRVSFATDISLKGFVAENGQMGLHPDVQKLAGSEVFLKGFMYPTKDYRDLTSFVLCKDSGDCCFGGQPKPTDMIFIEMQPGKVVDHRPGLVAVAGKFEATPTMDPTGLNPVYKLTCEYFAPAKTSY
ncbi:MAG TPA: hypothetical protein VM165_01050 [Planctomycetaceae bacterium]|nr:hypothetical protein [Planctomycetaceae bacterium]